MSSQRPAGEAIAVFGTDGRMNRPRLALGRAAAAITLGIATVSMTGYTDSTSSLEASPAVGKAPLVVTFTGRGSGTFEGVMLLDFGDGQTDDSISTIRSFTRKHTYRIPGSYAVELKSGPSGGQHPPALKTVGRVTITVR